jgi:hypothetical protein
VKYCISIFCLPHEIDDLENTLTQLHKALQYVDSSNFYVDITLGLSGELNLWKASKIPMDYFFKKYDKLRKNFDCIPTENKFFRIEQNSDVLGCVSKRRKTWIEHKDVDYHIWLDTDIIFDERTLAYIDSSIKSIDEEYPYSIVTPEIVKVWDNTWDCLVNYDFLNQPLDYQKTNNPYKDSGIKGDISVETIYNNIPNQPAMKFAGGWFTCISKKLLDEVTVPDSLGHYGLEDTYIMWWCEHHQEGKQFKIRNLVVCENYRYRNNEHISTNIANIDRRGEFKKQAEIGFESEVKKWS